MFRLPVKRAVKLINKAKEEETKARLFQMWLMRFTLMDKENFISFEEFYENATVPQIDTRPKDEIMSELLGG